MTSPFSTDLLKLISTDGKIVELGALESWPFKELIIGDVQPFEVRECVVLSEHIEVLDSIVREVQSCQSRESVERAHICQAVIGKIDNGNILNLFSNLGQLLKLLRGAVDVGELEGFFVSRVV